MCWKNQVIGWATGIPLRGPNKTVRKNVISKSGTGIAGSAGSVVTGNVVIENSLGIALPAGSMIVEGNAAVSNTFGIGNHGVGPPGGGFAFTGSVERRHDRDDDVRGEPLQGEARDQTVAGRPSIHEAVPARAATAPPTDDTRRRWAA